MKIFSKETKHLFYWQIEWFMRFLTTSYHLVNRKAYRRYKERRGRQMVNNVDFLFLEDFHWIMKIDKEFFKNWAGYTFIALAFSVMAVFVTALVLGTFVLLVTGHYLMGSVCLFITCGLAGFSFALDQSWKILIFLFREDFY